MTEPEERKSRSLKKACITRWNIPAMNAPMPTAATMKPSWLMVEYASTFLISNWATAIVAANKAVTAPTIATQFWATGTSEYKEKDLATKYTPAVTIVAAWIKADTGVGPAIASGSQTYSGNWADLPVTPSSMKRVVARMTGGAT